MSVYADPDRHAANPPETWEVRKAAERVWHVVDREGTVLERCATRARALEEIEDGMVRRLYDKETRWYAGEQIHGWRQYAELIAERATR